MLHVWTRLARRTLSSLLRCMLGAGRARNDISSSPLQHPAQTTLGGGYEWARRRCPHPCSTLPLRPRRRPRRTPLRIRCPSLRPNFLTWEPLRQLALQHLRTRLAGADDMMVSLPRCSSTRPRPPGLSPHGCSWASPGRARAAAPSRPSITAARALADDTSVSPTGQRPRPRAGAHVPDATRPCSTDLDKR